MKRSEKKEKPLLAKNIIARRKALKWSGHRLAEEARIPFPTLRDIELGTSGGREETRLAIAKALGCSLADLYQEPTDDRKSQPGSFPSREFFERLIENPKAATLEDAQRWFQKLDAMTPEKRAFLVAFAFENFEIARPYLPDDASPKLRTLLKAL